MMRKYKDSRNAGLLMWIVQGLLAVLFLFAGGMKLVLPLQALTEQSSLPGLFLRFIGVCQVPGALGLILPGLLHIQEGLTPLAAAGLVVIMRTSSPDANCPSVAGGTRQSVGCRSSSSR